MPKKINLSARTKQAIKDRYTELVKSPATLAKLNDDERAYFNKVKGGKTRAASSIRYEGKFLGGEVVNLINRVADRKGVTIEQYMETNSKAVEGMIERGYEAISKNPEDTSDIIKGYRRRKLDVDTGNGIVKMDKLTAIQNVQLLQQWAKSNTAIAALGIDVKIYKTGRIGATIPEPATYQDMTPKQFKQLLDDLGIWYIESDPNASKK